MSQLYNNKELLNNGFHLNGKAPIDDRTLFDMLSDLYVDGTHPERHPLFNRAYKGMQVAVFTDSADGRYEALNLTLLDAAPYIPENNITLNADNFDQYWSIAGNVVQRYVDNVVDPSINRLWDYTRTTNIFNKDNTGAITVETDNYAQVGEHIVGSVYNLKINTDDDTIKIVGDALAGGKYKLTKMAGDAIPSGMFSAYKLSYKAPDSNDYVDLSGTGDALIEIPKAQVLSDVHVCKAQKNEDGTYTETHRQGEEGYDEDPNPVCLHMIWDTPGDGSVEQTKDTYIEIKEMISVDLTGLRQDIQDLQDASIEIYDRLAAADSSINENKIYFNGGTMPKGNATLNKFGNLPKGTTIAQLEAMTMSEILKKILYEVATATKTRDQSASISWKSYGTEQEVGANMPAVANVSIGYLSEQWKVITSSGDTFATYTLSKINNTNTDYFWNTTGQKSGGVSLKSPDYSNNKVGAGKNYVYVDVAYDGYQDALNSDGTLAQEKKSGNIIANNVLQFTGLWHMYSNATEYSQNSLYSLKNVNPEGGFKGNDAKEPLNGAFAKSGSKLYFQWPRDTTASQVFHIYVPYDLVPTGIWQASDSKDEVYDVSVPYTAGNTSVGILNSKNVMGRYRDYVLTKTPGITTVEVTLGNNA